MYDVVVVVSVACHVDRCGLGLTTTNVACSIKSSVIDTESLHLIRRH